MFTIPINVNYAHTSGLVGCSRKSSRFLQNNLQAEFSGYGPVLPWYGWQSNFAYHYTVKTTLLF